MLLIEMWARFEALYKAQGVPTVQILRVQWGACWNEFDWPMRVPQKGKVLTMNTLLIIAGVVAIVLLLVGGFAPALNFLLWVGLIILAVAALGWLLSFASGRRTHGV